MADESVKNYTILGHVWVCIEEAGVDIYNASDKNVNVHTRNGEVVLHPYTVWNVRKHNG